VGHDPKRTAVTLRADLSADLTAAPTPRPSPGGSDRTRLRPATSFPELLEEPPELPLVPVDAGHYTVGDEVARGGLGRILRAHDHRLRREVALKVLRVRDRAAELRFMREALVTARLQHPAIVPIYEAGRWPDGEPFYAMKLLSGKALSDLIDERPTLEARLALLPNVIAVVDAIAYAHDKQVIHRDLKPANIMVCDFGETVVIDWGLAKDLADTEATSRGPATPPGAHSHETIAGSVLGTPSYMPAEQAMGRQVDRRADVYSLGAVLYHLLTGSIPLSELSPAEALRRVMLGPLPDIAEVMPSVPEDLAAIVRKAMAFEVAGRYPSARELAADLRRFETGQLVSVRRYVWWEVPWRQMKRHRAAVAVAATAAVALLGVGGFSVRRVVEERNVALAERKQAEAARAEADRRRDDLVLVQAKSSLERDPTAALAWLKQHPGGDALAELRTIASDAASRGVARHVLRQHEGRVTGLSFGGGALVSCGTDGRLVSYDLATGAARLLVDPLGTLWVLARSPDGTTLAVTGSDDRVRLIHPPGTDRFLELGRSPALSMRFSPDGKWIAAGTVSGRIWLWDVTTGERHEVPPLRAEVRDVVFSPDSGQLAAVSWDGMMQVYALATGALKTFRAHSDEIYAIDWSPDGKLLASGGEDGTVRLWDPGGKRLAELRGHRGQVMHLKFSPDGGTLATASRDHTVRLWAVPFQQVRTLEGHTGDVLRIAFAPDGKTLASAGTDRTVRLWDIDSGTSRVLTGHESPVHALDFSPDGALLASAGQDGSVRVWSVAAPGQRRFRGLTQVALSPSGTAAVGIGAGGTLTRIDGSRQASLPGTGWRFMAFTDETRVVALDSSHRVIAWEAGSSEPRTLGTLNVDVGSAVEASGHLALGAWDGTLRLWRLSDGLEQVWRAHQNYTLTAVASPDGSVIATGGDEGLVKLWTVSNGESRQLKGHVGPVHHVRFSPDGRRLVSGDLNGHVRVWDSATGKLLAQDEQHGFVRALAFSPDGALFASSGDSKVVRVRRVDGSGEAVVLKGPEQPVHELQFSDDGALLAVASADQTVQVFDWRNGAARLLRRHTAAVSHLAFTADGGLVSVDTSGGAWSWSRAEIEPMPVTREGLGAWLDATTTARVVRDHRPRTAAP
jgi:WD40 repeat protein